MLGSHGEPITIAIWLFFILLTMQTLVHQPQFAVLLLTPWYIAVLGKFNIIILCKSQMYHNNIIIIVKKNLRARPVVPSFSNLDNHKMRVSASNRNIRELS